jgi:uncharacterized DUF497 family protein
MPQNGRCRVQISYDPRKRALTLELRGLDFEDAAHVFAGQTVDYVDDRHDYGEVRWTSVGLLQDRMVVLVWTARGNVRHIISMRKANEREQEKHCRQLGS